VRLNPQYKVDYEWLTRPTGDTFADTGSFDIDYFSEKFTYMKRNVWVNGNPKPQKLDNSKKMKIIKEVESFIENSQKLSKSINRFELRAGRVYFFQLIEQFGWNDPKNKFIMPLIDGWYAEFKYARITIYP